MIRNDYYGVPDWLMAEYLTDLGGTEAEKFVIEGDGWSARIGKAEPNRIGSLVIGGASVEFSGDEEALDALFDELHKKTLRGGG